MASHLIVDVDYVPTAPSGFQQYIEDYFVKKTVMGKEVYSATRYVNGYNQYNFGRRSKGTAPSHSIDLMHYSKDMPDGISLCTWIRDRVTDGLTCGSSMAAMIRTSATTTMTEGI